jgi:hypothetical protein
LADNLVRELRFFEVWSFKAEEFLEEEGATVGTVEGCDPEFSAPPE